MTGRNSSHIFLPILNAFERGQFDGPLGFSHVIHVNSGLLGLNQMKPVSLQKSKFNDFHLWLKATSTIWASREFIRGEILCYGNLEG